MATVEAVGRDIAAAADSNFDAPVAAAIKSLWAWAGFDQADNPDHAYAVTATSDADGFTLSAVVTDRNVYVHPTQPDVPASADEVARAQTLSADAPPVDAPAIEVAPAADAAPEPEPAAAEDPGHAEAVDNAIVAVNVAADPATPADTRQAALDQARADADAALAQWPDSPQLQDLKTQLDQLAGDTGDPGPAA